jgi:hypothetical protein
MSDLPGGEPVPASDAERDQVAHRLVQAVGQGTLPLGTYTERVGQVYEARTRGELDRLLADLPQQTPSSMPGTRDRRKWVITPIGALVRRGRWWLPRRMVFLAVMGGFDLDLRQARLSAPGASLTAVMLTGGGTIVVPDGITVALTSFHLMGGREVDADDSPNPDAPVFTVWVFSLLGAVRITRGQTGQQRI